MIRLMNKSCTVFFKTENGYSRYVARHCHIEGGIYDKTIRAMVNDVGKYTVYIGDVKDYTDGIFTLKHGDLIVFGIANDNVPLTRDEFEMLVDKYDDNISSIVVSNINRNIFFDTGGKPWNVNHIEVNNG